MSRTSPAAPLLEKLFFLPEEIRDPDRRFDKSLFLFVLLAAGIFETFLALTCIFLGHLNALAAHLGLAAFAFGSLTVFRTRFRPWPYAVILVAIAWFSSLASLFLGIGTASLLWHLFLPTGFLILRGARWGTIILVLDILLALAQFVLFLPLFGVLSIYEQSTLWFFLSWELAACFLFVSFLILRTLLRQTLAAYREEKGQTLDQLSLTRDSETRWADQARFLETLMDVIPFPLFHKGVDGRFLGVNAAFQVVFDVQKEAITGQRNEAFLVAENAKTLAKIELDVMARDSMAVEEAVLIHADGHPHDFIVYLMPFIDEKQTHLGSIGVLIDITDRKRREEKLVQANSTKDQLFSIISHDLRGPVGKIKQLLEIYMDDQGIFDKATWEQVFHDMRRSSDSLFQLLENLLSWARTRQGEEHILFESIALEPIVNDIFSVLRLLTADKRIVLETNLKLGGPLLTDRHVLSTILRNLVHNSLKFTNTGGKITVSAEETPDDLWIEVRDTGTGMSSETLDRIFEKKEQFSTFGTGKEKGTGIGLGLCRDLAASIGAYLTATSSLGGGTAIRLHLPTPEL